MQLLQSAFIPALLAWTGLYALYKGVDVFPTFLHGAKKGLQTAVDELLLYIEHGDVMAVGQENFRNACAHVAGAEYTYFHDFITSLSR